MITVRPATQDDVPAIVVLIAQNARKGGLLPRGEASIRAHIGNFLVACHSEQSEESPLVDGPDPLLTLGVTEQIVGCGSLLPMNTTLVELALAGGGSGPPRFGIGQKIVAALIEEARKRNFGTLFALTCAVGFFEKCGFVVATLERISSPKGVDDCVQCPMTCLENRDEVAVMMPLQQTDAKEIVLPAEDRERVLQAVQAGRSGAPRRQPREPDPARNGHDDGPRRGEVASAPTRPHTRAEARPACARPCWPITAGWIRRPSCRG